jgi:anthranilate 1,2-dioxygenase large subunit
VFPTFVLQQIQNAIAVHQIVPRGTHRSDLHWTLIGFASDTPEQRRAQANLVGPAGYVSMEDGCVGGFVQRGNAGAGDARAIVEMGGSATENSESWVTEASVRGFWKAYRAAMGIQGCGPWRTTSQAQSAGCRPLMPGASTTAT